MKVGNPYSIWLRPQTPLIDEIQQDVFRISQDAKTPNCQAHVTLIPDEVMDRNRLIEKVTEVAMEHKILHLEFTAVGISTEFWKSLYLHVKPTQELIDIRNDLFAAFDLEITPFMPHLSIMYSDNIVPEKKYELRKKYRLERYIGKLWNVDRISVYLTRQEDVYTNGWEKITEIALG